MALYYDLQVFKDVYSLVQKVFLYTQDFPREYKYTLAQDMKRDVCRDDACIVSTVPTSRTKKQKCWMVFWMISNY